MNSFSDRQLLDHARQGSHPAAEALLQRWGIELDDVDSVMAAWRRQQYCSMNAAKRIAEAQQ